MTNDDDDDVRQKRRSNLCAIETAWLQKESRVASVAAACLLLPAAASSSSVPVCVLLRAETAAESGADSHQS